MQLAVGLARVVDKASIVSLFGRIHDHVAGHFDHVEVDLSRHLLAPQPLLADLVVNHCAQSNDIRDTTSDPWSKTGPPLGLARYRIPSAHAQTCVRLAQICSGDPYLVHDSCVCLSWISNHTMIVMEYCHNRVGFKVMDFAQRLSICTQKSPLGLPALHPYQNTLLYDAGSCVLIQNNFWSFDSSQEGNGFVASPFVSAFAA